MQSVVSYVLQIGEFQMYESHILIEQIARTNPSAAAALYSIYAGDSDFLKECIHSEKNLSHKELSGKRRPLKAILYNIVEFTLIMMIPSIVPLWILLPYQ